MSYRGNGTIRDQAPKNVSQQDELQRLLDITQKCAAQARAARQQASRYASDYRTRAEHFQKQAARAGSAEMRTRLLQLASLYDALATQGLPAEGVEALRAGSSDLPKDQEPFLDDEQPSNAAERGEGSLQQRSAEHSVAQARRHIAEAQDHIARQKALVARLSSDDQHVALAADAQKILDTLKHTLSLAQQHLALETEEVTRRGEGLGMAGLRRDFLSAPRYSSSSATGRRLNRTRIAYHQRMKSRSPARR